MDLGPVEHTVDKPWVIVARRTFRPHAGWPQPPFGQHIRFATPLRELTVEIVYAAKICLHRRRPRGVVHVLANPVDEVVPRVVLDSRVAYYVGYRNTEIGRAHV